MSAQLLKDTVNYERLVGEGTGQTMISQDLVLSDRSPEVGNVLSIDGKVNVISAETREDKVVVDGKITVDVFYSSSEDSRGIYKLSTTNNFTQNINLPLSDNGMKSIVDAKIDHIEYEIASNRKIKVNSIVNLDSVVYSRESAEVVVDIRGEEIQLLKNNIEFGEYLGEDKSQAIIKTNINIPEDKEEISSILKSEVNIHRKDVTVQDGMVLVTASGTSRVMYDTSSEDIVTVEDNFTFESEVALVDVTDSSRCSVDFNVIDVYENVKEDDVGERRTIEIESVVDVSAKGYGERSIQTIQDAYSPTESFDFEKETINSLSFFTEGQDSQTIKERISLDSDDLPILEIKYVSIKPIVSEVKVVDDKVIGEGILDVDILYSVDKDGAGISGIKDEIPFKATIDIKGAKIDMLPKFDIGIEHISFDKISSKEIDIKIILNATSKLIRKNNIDLIKNVVESEMSEKIKSMPTVVIYSVQRSDNLWKIAKRYATTIEDIIRVNELNDPENVPAGTKIIIPKKAFIS